MTAHHSISKNHYLSCISEAELCSNTLKRIEEYGFDFFFFRMIPRLGNITTNSKVITNYPNDYVDRYEKGHLSQKNPLLTHCQLSILPIIWSSDVFRETPDQWRATQNCGLTYGWSQSVHDPNGAVSMLSLARKSTPVTEDEFSDKAAMCCGSATNCTVPCSSAATFITGWRFISSACLVASWRY